MEFNHLDLDTLVKQLGLKEVQIINLEGAVKELQRAIEVMGSFLDEHYVDERNWKDDLKEKLEKENG